MEEEERINWREGRLNYGGADVAGRSWVRLRGGRLGIYLGWRRHAEQPMLHGLEVGAVGLPCFGGTQLRDFLVYLLNAVLGVRVVREKLHRAVWIFLLDDLEELRHGMGIVASLVKGVGANLVGLRLDAARIVQKYRFHAETDAVLGQPAQPASPLAQSAAENRQRRLSEHHF